jgi:aryl-alcohol dehydrogenase-like predicted oxidoreductase
MGDTMDKLANKKYFRFFGNTKRQFYPLGLGTIWFGRPWPMDNKNYRFPEDKEILDFLYKAFNNMGNAQGVVMIDTAAAYGHSEEKIGLLLKGNAVFYTKAFIATKWGEEFDLASGISVIDHSPGHLRASVARSHVRLGKIDLLYIHGTTVEVLSDQVVMAAMRKMKQDQYAGIKYIGASISREDVLEYAAKKLSLGLDAIQLPAWLLQKRTDLIDILYTNGVAVVLNSVVRDNRSADPRGRYNDFLNNDKVSMVLTGTRNHLDETIGYVEESGNSNKSY